MVDSFYHPYTKIFKSYMKVKIHDLELELHYSMRMMIIYENITGDNFDFTNMQSIKQLTSLFLSCILASAKKNKIDLQLTYDEFMDWIDDNGGYKLLNEFATWLAVEIKAKYELLKEEKEDLPKSTRKKAKD